MDYYYGAIIASIIFTILGVIIGIAAYILTALGLYAIAKNRGMENPWLAWIPIAQFYIIGAIVKELKFGTAFTIPKMELVLPLGCLAAAILGGIPVLGLADLDRLCGGRGLLPVHSVQEIRPRAGSALHRLELHRPVCHIHFHNPQKDSRRDVGAIRLESRPQAACFFLSRKILCFISLILL